MSTRGIIVGIAAASVVVASAGAISTATATASPRQAEHQEPPAVAAAPAPSGHASPIAVSRNGRVRPAASPAVATRVAAQKRFATFTLRSKATRDLRGVERSLYRGKFYRASVEEKRRCIATRESEGHYDVVSSSGLYYGAYQVSRPLARGATWMMLREHKRLMGVKQAKSVLSSLRSKPMNRWPRYWQDAAFHTVMNWEHTGSGAAHWAGGRWHC